MIFLTKVSPTTRVILHHGTWNENRDFFVSKHYEKCELDKNFNPPQPIYEGSVKDIPIDFESGIYISTRESFILYNNVFYLIGDEYESYVNDLINNELSFGDIILLSEVMDI